jgi:hypothetical protein
MSQSLSPETGGKKLPYGNGGKCLWALLILLLLGSVLCGIYFFTDLFGSNVKVPLKPGQNVVIKKPMPQRRQQAKEVKPEQAVASTQQGVKPANALPGTPPPPPVEPAVVKKSKPDQIIAKSVTHESSRKEAHLQPQRQTKTGLPVKTPGKVGAIKKVGNAEKPLSVNHAKAGVPVATKAEKGKFTLLIGVFVLEKSMTAVKARLKSAGLPPVISKGSKKIEPMNRLFVAVFNSRPEAMEELLKLRKFTGDAFILPEEDKYKLYAGSYFTKGRAESELNRLTGQGVKPVLQKTDAPVSTMRLTAGNFSTRKEAEAEVLHLKKLGITASIVKVGA